jgi:hypothetical protein
MPYEHKKVGKNDVVVEKADSGKVVGHTTPGKLNKYLAALHIHAGDNANTGGVVEIPKGEFIEEHERLLPKLQGEEKKEQMNELKDVRGYTYGGEVEDKVKKNLIEKYNQPQVSYTPPQPMARGGIAGEDSPYDLGISQSTATAQGSPVDDGGTSAIQYMPTSHEAMSGDYLQPKFNPNAGLPPASVQTPEEPTGRPPVRNSGVTPIGGYLDTQREQLGRYGPEQLQALQAQIAKERTGLGRNLASAGGMFADTIISGIGRAQSPGFGASIEGEQARRDAERLGTFEKAGSLNTQQVESRMKLDAIDPRSELSKGAQATYGSLLVQLGFSPQMIGTMSAQSIADVTGKSIEKMKAESEAKMAAASLGLRQQAETRESKTAEAAAQARDIEQRSGAAKALSARGPFKRMTDIVYTSPETEFLKNQVAGIGPDVLDYAKLHGITPEQAQTIKMKRTGGQ